MHNMPMGRPFHTATAHTRMLMDDTVCRMVCAKLQLLIRSLSWDDYFMALAFLSAERSKDPNKQVCASRPSAAQAVGLGAFC